MKENETDERELLAAFAELNDKGRAALFNYSDYLRSLDKYRKRYKVEGREGNVIHVKRT